MTKNQDLLFKLTNSIFDAALGKAYYEQIYPMVVEQGIDSLAQSWGESDLVKSFLGNSPKEQALNLTKNFGLEPNGAAEGSAPSVVYNYFLDILENGMNVGTLALSAIRYLEQDEILPILNETRDYVSNRSEFSYQYTIGFGLGGTDISELQGVLSSVSENRDEMNDSLLAQFEQIFSKERAEQLLSDFDDDHTGTNFSEMINAGDGDDTVYSEMGNDYLIGGDGDDYLDGGKGLDKIEGGVGNDQIFGGTSINKIYHPNSYNEFGGFIPGYLEYEVDVSANLLDGGSGNDYIFGGLGGDIIYGGEGVDTIRGDGGAVREEEFYMLSSEIRNKMYNDTIYGGSGDDEVYGGAGSDFIYGGNGDDYIESYSQTFADGVNTIYGEDGNDSIVSLGVDIVYGGDGNDSIVSSQQNKLGQEGLIVPGEGQDKVTISYSDFYSYANELVVDLQEENQVEDIVVISLSEETQGMPVIENFDLLTDKLSFGRDVNVYSLEGDTDTTAWEMKSYNFFGEISRDAVQFVADEATPFITYQADGEPPYDIGDYGKAFFIIQGAQANSSDREDVAEFIDAYGDDAQYGKYESHMFFVNVDVDKVGIYKFTDDSAGDNNVIEDEIVPLAILSGMTTEDFTTVNTDFIIS